MSTSTGVAAGAAAFEIQSEAAIARRELEAAIDPLVRGLEGLDLLCTQLTKEGREVGKARATVDHLAMFLSAVREYMTAVDLAAEQAASESPPKLGVESVSPLSSGMAERQAIVEWLHKPQPFVPVAMNATRRLAAEDIQKGKHLQ